jgi:hypothetical protein
VAAGPSKTLDQIERAVREFFEPQLLALGLTTKQIQTQDLAQLEVSLERINEAIANADSFGKIRLSLTASAGVVIATQSSEHIVERGILPILLEQKARILDRIRVLRPEEQLSNLRADVANKVDDPQAREQMLNIIDHRFEEERAAREGLDREQAQVEVARVEALEREQRLLIEIRERRWAIYRSFIERESMASIMGAVLLLALAVVLATAMFTHTAPPDVITNAFLLILGYFFGTTTIRAQATRQSKGEDT